jgi:hypothetical protein
MTKLLSILLLFACISWISCNNISSEIANNNTDSAKTEIAKVIDKDSILKIAEKNAKTAYRDLSGYNVKAELKEGKWYVDYELSNPEMVGGGPHYVISAETGEILSSRYEQ